MKKLLLTVLIGCALLSMAPMAVHATAPTEVSGEADYWVDFGTAVMTPAGPNTFMDATEHEDWRGDMSGTGNSEFSVAMLAAGFWTVELRCEFEGKVDDREGTLQIQLVGKKPLDEDWFGSPGRAVSSIGEDRANTPPRPRSPAAAASPPVNCLPSWPALVLRSTAANSS